MGTNVPTAYLSLRGVRKDFEGTTAVHEVSLDAEEGSFTCLLGPSGCGKTTTLRMIAGFLVPDAGDVVVDGASVVRVPPNRRPTSIVFQDYALFPHMTVRDNVGFGLMPLGLGQDVAAARLARTLELLDLAHLTDRHPHQLSGGQQQRVALARSLVTEPKVLLMDEPLSNLDAKLRVRLRADLRALQRDLGLTTVYVTHDQEEALAMADQVAVMHDGRIAQLGSPRDLYFTPADRFVADFIGRNNLIEVDLVGADPPRAQIRLGDGQELEARIAADLHDAPTATASIRPEAIAITDPSAPVAEGHQALRGEVRDVEFLGAAERFRIRIGDQAVEADLPAGRTASGFAAGSPVHLVLRADDVRVLPPETSAPTARPTPSAV